MTRVLGIDFGHHSIKIAELELSSKAPQIIGLYEVRPREGQDKAGALREFFGQNKIRSERIGINLNNTSTLVKRVDLPFKDRKKVQLAVEGEWMDALPFELDGFTIETRHMGRHGRTHSFMSALCPSQTLSEINDLCESAWIKPNAVFLDAESLGLLALHQRLPKSQGAESYIVVDFGYEITKLAILRGSDPLTNKRPASDSGFIEPEILELRHIDKGSREWIQWIADRRRVPTEEALQWLIHRAEIQSTEESTEENEKASIREDLSDDIKSALRPVVVEIYQTLQSCKVRTGYSPEILFITGSMCEIQGLKEFLEHELRVEVQAWPLFLGFNAMEAMLSPQNQRSFATALSIAHAFYSNKSGYLNFRRNTHVRKRLLTETLNQLLGPNLKPSFALLGVSLAFVWIYSIAGSFFLTQQSQALQTDLTGEFRRLDNTMGDRAPNFVGDPERAREIFDKLKQTKLASAEPEIDQGPQPQVVILEDFSLAAPAGVKVSMLETQKANKRLLIEANATHDKAGDKDALSQNMNQYVTNLQRAGYSDVQISKTGSSFKLKAKWSQPEKKKAGAR